jgi:hypothetical protein
MLCAVGNGSAAFSPDLKEGESMGWLDGRFKRRRKYKKPRPEKEKCPAAFPRCEMSGWKVLDAQLLLEHWFRGNGVR